MAHGTVLVGLISTHHSSINLIGLTVPGACHMLKGVSLLVLLDRYYIVASVVLANSAKAYQ